MQVYLVIVYTIPSHGWVDKMLSVII
jgi:hypothetical protein